MVNVRLFDDFIKMLLIALFVLLNKLKISSKAFDAFNNWLKDYVASLDGVYMVDFFNAQENGKYFLDFICVF